MLKDSGVGRVRSAAARLTLLVVGTGCSQPHVTLNAPSATAPPEERLAAYRELAPISMHETHYVYSKGGPTVARETDYLQLESGRRVYHATDLLPVVPEDSPTADAARESDSRASTATLLMVGSYALMIVGGAVALAPILSHEPGSDEDIDLTPAYIGIGMMMAGLPLILFSMSQRRLAEDAQATAFETYDRSLRKKLSLCLMQNRIVPCPP